MALRGGVNVIPGVSGGSPDVCGDLEAGTSCRGCLQARDPLVKGGGLALVPFGEVGVEEHRGGGAGGVGDGGIAADQGGGEAAFE